MIGADDILVVWNSAQRAWEPPAPGNLVLDATELTDEGAIPVRLSTREYTYLLPSGGHWEAAQQ